MHMGEAENTRALFIAGVCLAASRHREPWCRLHAPSIQLGHAAVRTLARGASLPQH